MWWNDFRQVNRDLYCCLISTRLITKDGNGEGYNTVIKIFSSVFNLFLRTTLNEDSLEKDRYI